MTIQVDRAIKEIQIEQCYLDRSMEMVDNTFDKLEKTLDRVHYLAKRRAQSTLFRAIRTGKVTRPDCCSSCGEPEKFSHDGRSLLQAIHKDFSKPLEVRWVCPTCSGLARRKTEGGV